MIVPRSTAMRIDASVANRRHADVSRGHVSLQRQPWGRSRAVRRAFGRCAALAMLGSVAIRVHAQSLEKTARLTVDNNYFNFLEVPAHRSDDNFTHGAKIAFDVGRPPHVIAQRLCAGHARCLVTVELGQEIEKPSRGDSVPFPSERPYARSHGGGRLYGLVLGVTGPISLPQTTQAAFHRAVPGFRPAVGWEHQLPNELALRVRAAQSWHIALPEDIADVAPTITATVDTLRIALGAGGRLRFGPLRSPLWDFVPRARKTSISLFIGGRDDVVAHDLFLDGSTYTQSVTWRTACWSPSGSAGSPCRSLGYLWNIG